MKTILAGVLGILLFSQGLAADEQQKEVGQLVRTSVNSVLKILKDKEIDREEKKARVMKVIGPLFDIPLMAKLVLGRRHWPKFSPEERKEFSDLFIKSLQDSYFEKINILTDEYVEFEQPIRNKEKFTMLTTIIAKENRYKVLYKLYSKKGTWRVYDVEIEGISFVKSYGSQYDQFLQENSVQELLTKMRQKILNSPEELNGKAEEKVNEKEAVKENLEKKSS